AAAADGEGGWYIGGKFTKVGDVERDNLAHILADGTVDMTWVPGSAGEPGGTNNTVYALAVESTDDGNRVYVGGEFDTIGGEGRESLAAINTNGEVNTNWGCTSTSSVVRALTMHGGRLYAGGGFTNLCGTGTNYLAAVKLEDGTVDQDWNPAPGGAVYTRAKKDNTLYVGGDFNAIGGSDANQHNRLAAFNVDPDSEDYGNVLDWQAGEDRGASEVVYALAVSGDVVYAGGGFEKVGGEDRSYLAAIDTDQTGTVLLWNPSAGNWVYALAASGNTIYIGGNFADIGNEERKYLAAIATDEAGTVLDWNPRTDRGVYALEVSSGEVYAGGAFITVNAEMRNNLAAFSADGGLLSWNPNADSEDLDMAIHVNRAYIGGHFTEIGGEQRNYLAAVNRATGAVETWNPHISSDSVVSALEIHGDHLYVGGQFSKVKEDDRNSLAKFNLQTGELLSSWNPGVTFAAGGTDIPGFVYTLKVNGSGNRLYVGGFFGKANGVSRRNLAAFGTGGTGNIASWAPSANNAVRALDLTVDWTYIGGDFSRIDDTTDPTNQHTRLGLAKIDASGNVNQKWMPEVNGDVHTLLAIDDAKIYVGGAFTQIGDGYDDTDIDRNKLAEITIEQNTGDLNLNGQSRITQWNPSLNGQVNVLRIWNGKIHTGGQFTTQDGELTGHYTVVDP
ncbi:MAG: hypothetical protein MJA83_19895, partial [Gammaproteobacteria bacterium]|nr:hypothetical protein [Gammaproteobacteria bacterium]